jgi:hypothetical protein
VLCAQYSDVAGRQALRSQSNHWPVSGIATEVSKARSPPLALGHLFAHEPLVSSEIIAIIAISCGVALIQVSSRKAQTPPSGNQIRTAARNTE